MHKVIKALAIYVLILSSSASLACEQPDQEWVKTLNSNKHIVKGPYIINQLEAQNMIEVREDNKILPFGYMNKSWEALQEKHQEGDRIYFVRFQDGHFFMEYHVLVRDGCIIGSLQGKIS